MAKKGSPTINKITNDQPQLEGQAAAAPQCRHYWLLEFPSGPTSRAVCKLCGATREFPNASEDYIYEDEAAPTLGSRRHRQDEE